MTGQVAKKVAAHVAGDVGERYVADPARKPPQQVVGGDEPDEQDEHMPHLDDPALRQGEGVDQQLDAVLREDRADNGQRYGPQDDPMGDSMPPQEAP